MRRVCTGLGTQVNYESTVLERTVRPWHPVLNIRIKASRLIGSQGLNRYHGRAAPLAP